MNKVYRHTREEGMGPLAAEVRVAELSDANEMAIHRLVSSYPPFNQFSYPLMLGKIREQLMLHSHVMLMVGDRLVGYAGWSPVDATEAEDWYQGRRLFPTARLEQATAAIVSITVVTSADYLPLIIKAISHQCAGRKVYRLRAFQDGRDDMRRPPILGKKQHIFSYQRAYSQRSSLAKDLYLRATGEQGKLRFPIPITTSPEAIQTVLYQPDRFSSNGEIWQRHSRVTQIFHGHATKQVTLSRLKQIYQQHLTGDASEQLFDRSLQAATWALSETFGLSKPIAWPLDKAATLSNELMLLQAIELFGGTQQERDTAQRNIASIRAGIIALWQADGELASWLQQLSGGFNASIELTQNMMAATQTTAATIEWMAKLLAAHPEILSDLRQSGVSDPHGELTHSAQQFILEVLRLYPPVPFITRVCQSDKPEEDGFRSGQTIAISLIGLHTRPEHWQQPMRFWPKRPEWAVSSAGKINVQHPAYMPFLSGPRACGGRKLAMLELQAALEVLVFERELTPKPNPPRVCYGMVLRPV